ncbi:MAG: hypothetical protein RLZZ07_866, partial [Actinomycetota bacterium]
RFSLDQRFHGRAPWERELGPTLRDLDGYQSGIFRHD